MFLIVSCCWCILIASSGDGYGFGVDMNNLTDADIKELESVIALLKKRNSTVKRINQRTEDDKTEQALSNILNAIKQNQSLDDVILWYGAFNYYCGRATYAVGVFVESLIKAWPSLSDKTRFLIERDLEKAFTDCSNGFNRLGHDCDRAEWRKVRALYKAKSNPSSKISLI